MAADKAEQISEKSGLASEAQVLSDVDEKDVFGREDGHDIKFKTLSWPVVACLMITEIVSNGTFSLPYAVATIGIAPALILIVFLGIWATYTSKLLVNFKLRHPHVHTMGDAGMLMFGPVGREILAFGTIAFAVLATGSAIFTAALSLSTLSDGRLCFLIYTGICTAVTMLCGLPRALDKLGWISYLAFVAILVAGILAIVGAAAHPVPGRNILAAQSASFYNAFTAVANPVFAYAGHFLFFPLISEMKNPKDAMKAAYTLQGFATVFYAIFAVLTYVWLGQTVQSPSLLSLNNTWSKIAFGIALPNFLIAGAMYTHVASKLVFVRLFRNSRHLHSHTLLSWSVWTCLILVTNGGAFVLAVGVPIFNYIVGLAASLFASWYTYGIAGFFLLYDNYHDGEGFKTWRVKYIQSSLAISTIVGGAFICVAGLYVTIYGIVQAYATNQLTKPFSC